MRQTSIARTSAESTRLTEFTKFSRSVWLCRQIEFANWASSELRWFTVGSSKIRPPGSIEFSRFSFHLNVHSVNFRLLYGVSGLSVVRSNIVGMWLARMWLTRMWFTFILKVSCAVNTVRITRLSWRNYLACWKRIFRLCRGSWTKSLCHCSSGGCCTVSIFSE